MGYEPTKEDIDVVRTLKEKGASDRECAEIMEISLSTFKRRKNLLTQPIKEAQKTRVALSAEWYEDSLKRQVLGYHEEEIEFEYTGPNEPKWTPKVKKRKYYPPNATLTMFTAVNMSNRAGAEGHRYQSINKVENTTIITNKPYQVGFQEENLNAPSSSV